jgi:hypothetical protein
MTQTNAIATEEQITELANAISNQAQALAEGRIKGPRSRYAAIKRMQNNLDTLAQWVGDDR